MLITKSLKTECFFCPLTMAGTSCPLSIP